MIELSADVDLVKFVQKVYELSKPQGLGFLHYEPGGLDEADAKHIVDRGKSDRLAVSMDYVNGRACKMTVFREDGKLQIPNSWHDHSDKAFHKLLQEFAPHAIEINE